MKKITLAAAVLLCAVIVSCKGNKETDTETTTEKRTYTYIEKAGWLNGSWGNATPEGDLSEIWTKVNDSVMHGESYFVVGSKDTVFAETIELAETKGKLVYTVTVPGQNNELPVPFEMTSATEGELVFANPQHDYPSKIVYTKIGNDSLVATISGVQNGKPANETFAMKRLK